MLRLFLALAATVAAFAADSAPPVFPREIKLTSGATLRNTSLVRWTSDGVVIKHAGGADPIRLAFIAEPHRSQVIAVRDAVPAPSTVPQVATKTGGAKTKNLTGQVFVTTKGAEAYKFTGARVSAYPFSEFANATQKKQLNTPSSFAQNLRAELEAWGKALSEIPVLGTSTTDTEGKFVLELPAATEVFLFCVGVRTYGRVTETNLWLVPVLSETATVSLNGNNCQTFTEGGMIQVR